MGKLETSLDDSADEFIQGRSSIPLWVIATDEDTLLFAEELRTLGPYRINLIDYEDSDPESFPQATLILINIRLMEAFNDLDIIRNWRRARPLLPILAISSNSDEDFMLEAFRAGASNYSITSTVTAAILDKLFESYHKLSESARMVEIQNIELLASMKIQREASETRMRLESEKKIAEAQAEANRSTREILDNLNEGFFIVEKDLSIAHVTSKACERIFQRSIASQVLGDALDLEKGREPYMQACFAQLFENLMPLELNLELLPKRCETLDRRIIAFSYTPVLDCKGDPEKVIVEAIDVSDVVRLQQKLEREKNLSDALMRILSGREAFGDFLIDSKRDLNELREAESERTGKRILHTLKGNSAAMGLMEIAEEIHKIEDEIEQMPANFSPILFRQYATKIETLFRHFLDRNNRILQISWDKAEPLFNLSEGEIAALSAFVRAAHGPNREAAIRIMNGVRLRSVKSMLGGFDSVVERFAERTDKRIRLKIEGEDLKLDPQRFAPLMKSLIHALRNSCDHGIESPEERLAKGKKPCGLIKFKFEKPDPGSLRIAFMDDGKGINAYRVWEKALDRGIIKSDRAELPSVKDVLQLIFHDGLSTAQEISETSGRGVGMSCIKNEVLRLGGKIRISSQENVGTLFEITIPESA